MPTISFTLPYLILTIVMEVGIIPFHRGEHKLRKVKEHSQDQVVGPDPDPELHDSKLPYTSFLVEFQRMHRQ